MNEPMVAAPTGFAVVFPNIHSIRFLSIHGRI